MSMFNAADQLDVGDDAERKREKEAERQRIEELTELYAYTLAKAEAEGNVDDWSELKSRRPATWSDSFYEFLGLQEKDDVPKPKEPTPEELEHETERVKLASKHWVNYDIRESLAPSLISEEEFDAAVKIGNLIRNFNARRAAARRRIGGEVKIMEREATKIKRIWRGYRGRSAMKEEKQRNFEEEKEWKAYEDFRTTLLNKGYTLSRWSHSKKILVPCTIRIDGSREYLVLSQNRFKSKQRRLKDIQERELAEEAELEKEIEEELQSDAADLAAPDLCGAGEACSQIICVEQRSSRSRPSRVRTSASGR